MKNNNKQIKIMEMVDAKLAEKDAIIQKGIDYLEKNFTKDNADVIKFYKKECGLSDAEARDYTNDTWKTMAKDINFDADNFFIQMMIIYSKLLQKAAAKENWSDVIKVIAEMRSFTGVDCRKMESVKDEVGKWHFNRYNSEKACAEMKYRKDNDSKKKSDIIPSIEGKDTNQQPA